MKTIKFSEQDQQNIRAFIRAGAIALAEKASIAEAAQILGAAAVVDSLIEKAEDVPEPVEKPKRTRKPE